MTAQEGGCLCGQVRIVAHGAPDRVGLCHCLDCRKQLGAVFFDASMVTVNGETAAYDERHFCPRCGSSVFNRSGREIEVHLDTFDDTSVFAPTYELWTSRKESWLPDMPELEGHTRDRRDNT